MCMSGIGERQLNTILSVMNLPGISAKSLKKREREVARSIIKVADETCIEAATMEKQMEIAATVSR
jgi:hypothetical protein